MAKLSIIMPTLNEAEGIQAQLAALQPLRERGCQLIVVDGGSSDETVERARRSVDLLVTAPRGRARQMNAGAAHASGEVLLFLHADTKLPERADTLIVPGLEACGRHWGRFDVSIEGTHTLLPVIAWFMNRRSRMTGIATGDQAIFVRRELFDSVGGYPAIALMEDIVLSRRLKRCGPPLCLEQQVLTSGRRWEKGGVMRTIVLMWGLRLAFFCGADPARLAKIYGYDSD